MGNANAFAVADWLSAVFVDSVVEFVQLATTVKGIVVEQYYSLGCNVFSPI
jgi:hypothetical protein